MKYKFEWITEWDEIWSDAFVSQWSEWMEKSENSHVFFHPNMVKAWVDTYMPIRDIKPIFCIASTEDINIFIPLVIWKKNWKNAFMNVIVPVGYSNFDYHTPIIVGNSDEFEWSLFWSSLNHEINREWNGLYDRIEIDGIPENYISESNHWYLVDESPLIELSNFESYEELIGVLKSKVRGDINRQLRRLKELGNFKYRVFTSDEVEDALSVLPAMLHHHSIRWPNAYKAQNYHANLIKKALPAGLMHFSQISIDDQPMCWNLSFTYQNTYYFYMPTYVEEYRKYSPGKVNMFLSMENMFELGYQKFDLLRGAEEYKNKLPTVTTFIYDLYNTNDGLSSKIKHKMYEFKKRIQS
jgi:CelD/BcsL family acetyltransferase involved in cellulose biosynthesis